MCASLACHMFHIISIAFLTLHSLTVYCARAIKRSHPFASPAWIIPGKGKAVTDRPSASSKDVFARERQEHIARIVEEHGRARVADLAQQFHVSAVTIRKDLVVLESEDRLVRTHGGAIAILVVLGALSAVLVERRKARN